MSDYSVAVFDKHEKWVYAMISVRSLQTLSFSFSPILMGKVFQTLQNSNVHLGLPIMPVLVIDMVSVL